MAFNPHFDAFSVYGSLPNQVDFIPAGYEYLNPKLSEVELASYNKPNKSPKHFVCPYVTFKANSRPTHNKYSLSGLLKV